jgi:hypothetical protein
MNWPILYYRPEKPFAEPFGCETIIQGTSAINGLLDKGFQTPILPGIRMGDRVILQ